MAKVGRKNKYKNGSEQLIVQVPKGKIEKAKEVLNKAFKKDENDKITES